MKFILQQMFILGPLVKVLIVGLLYKGTDKKAERKKIIEMKVTCTLPNTHTHTHTHTHIYIYIYIYIYKYIYSE